MGPQKASVIFGNHVGENMNQGNGAPVKRWLFIVRFDVIIVHVWGRFGGNPRGLSASFSTGSDRNFRLPGISTENDIV